VLASSRTADTLASGASGRSAVTLADVGRYVEFTLTKPANAVDVHYSIPDSTDGSPYTAPLSVYVDGTFNQALTLANRYSWFYGGYPFTNSPSAGNPHHFYDDVRTTFSSTLPAGAKVRLKVDSGSTATTVDTADFEQIALVPQPAGSLSVTIYGADPNGAVDSGPAFDQAIAAGRTQGRVVLIPAGTYTINRHVIVDDVTVHGAGPWYSVVRGDVNFALSIDVHPPGQRMPLAGNVTE
jgi:hypothetical protein